MAARTKADLQKCAVATHGKFQTERSACKISRYLQKLPGGALVVASDRYGGTPEAWAFGKHLHVATEEVFNRSFCNRNIMTSPHFCPLILEPASEKCFCKFINLANEILLLVRDALHS